MAKALIVREMFNDADGGGVQYGKGEIINDPAIVERLLANNNVRSSITPFMQPDPPAPVSSDDH